MVGIKTILITGATGYLGSNLIESLLAGGFEIIALKRKSSDLKRIKHLRDSIKLYDLEDDSYFKNCSVDCVIHTAASYGRKGESLTDIYDANLFFPVRFLERCLAANVKFFINTSTALPADLNFYSLSKKQFSDILKMSSDLIKIIDVELQYFFGPGDDNSKFITFVISEILKGKPSIDFSSGMQVRDFIYIKDVVAAYRLLIERIDDLADYQLVPLGYGCGVTLKELTITIKTLMNNHDTILNFGALPFRDREIMDSVADTGLLRSLGWEPGYLLNEALVETINVEKSFFYDNNRQ